MILPIIYKGFACIIAAIGFAILFNAPKKALYAVALLAFLGGIVKYSLLHFSFGIVLGTFFASLAIGSLSIPLAHKVHLPPIVFSIPSVIPMVPGAFAYKTMLGIFNLLKTSDAELEVTYVVHITNNFLNTTFILLAIAVGVALPVMLSRKSSVKNIKFPLQK